jgi:3-phytase
VFEGDTDIAAYGIAAWQDDAGRAWVEMSQRHQTNLLLARLVAGRGGTVGFARVDTLQPDEHDPGRNSPHVTFALAPV